MKFELDEDLSLLKSSTRELLERESPLAQTRSIMEESPEGYSKALYASLGELGYPALLLDEEQGGMGAPAFAAVLSEMGRVAFPGPFLDLTLAVRTLAGATAPEAAGWRQRAAAGEALVVLARAGSGASSAPDPTSARFEAGRVTGRKSFVPFGAQADALLVETREGLALVERPGTGWNATPLPTLDHAQRFAEISFDDPAVAIADPARCAELLAEADRLGALGAAAILLGLMERSLELAVAYTAEREAFGVPIGSFQALQHRCADMLLQTESTRSAVFRAAWAEQAAPQEAAYLAAVAKAWAGPAARFVCGQSIQLHGGVGFTWEYDPHIYLKRAKTLEQFHGATRSQLEAVLARSAVISA
jgi:alkylation response protein AidB-like acyl-CoA dehydrogenase